MSSLSGGSNLDEAARRRRRTAVAAVMGAALFVAGGVATIGDFAIARGGAYTPIKSIEITPSGNPRFSDGPAIDRHVRASSHAGLSRAVCVRLCDGFFFPTSSTAGGDESCQAQCPDAPVAMYSQRGDAIEDAVSLTGERYSALPVALRNRTTFDNACTCHRSLDRSWVAELTRDVTLRRGDVVMTGNGFRVFEGGARGDAAPSDFVSLAQARSLPKGSRDALLVMERATVGSVRTTDHGAVTATSASEPPRLRGVVTVDDGSPIR